MQPPAVTFHRTLRREDRPARIARTLGKPGRDRLDDVMRGLEPRQLQRRCPAVVHGVEAQERLHLVDVAPYRLPHLVGVQHVGVDRVVPQPGLVHQPPQQAVQQGEALGVVVQHHDLAQAQERRRHDGRSGLGQGLGPAGGRGIGEQVAVLRVRGLPLHGLRRHLLRQQGTGFFAEAREVGFAGQPRFHVRFSLPWPISATSSRASGRGLPSPGRPATPPSAGRCSRWRGSRAARR